MNFATVIFILIAIIVFGVFAYIVITDDGTTESFDEMENNPYGVAAPKGRMIDRFGYGK